MRLAFWSPFKLYFTQIKPFVSSQKLLITEIKGCQQRDCCVRSQQPDSFDPRAEKKLLKVL
jgi:hypothetical protein